jgi:hypothetical protein
METRQRETQATDGQAPSTTVITIGLTPPIIGGGLALGYLAVKRIQNGAEAGRADTTKPAVQERAGQAAASVAGGAGEMLGSITEAAAGSVQTVTETAGRVVSGAGQAASAGSATVANTARMAVTTGLGAVREVPRLAKQNPAVALGFGIGVGALAALVIPATRTEEELIRPASEKVAQQVKTSAQETVEKVQLVADEAATTIKESATEVGLVPSGTGG